MNNTTKKKYDLAARMLKSEISIDEVSMMTGLDKEKLEKLNEEIKANKDESEIIQKIVF